MAIIDLPSALRISDRSDPHLSPLNRSGGVAMNGEEQVIGTGASRWIWRAVLPIRDAASARALRWVKSQLKGRINYLRVTVCDQYRITRREVGWLSSDGTMWDNDQPFDNNQPWAALQPVSTLDASASEGATTIVIDADAVSDFMALGVFFSLDDWLYQVTDYSISGDDMTLTFEPPLKADATSGAFVLFHPRSIWVLASDDEARLDLRNGRFGAVELNLVEAIGRDT